ncbi:MAG: hypothetical protein IJR99_11165 [Kiritimatiellae bacterium]|nr:hypothetical protein [Kiritimatiellia bacterium]
MKNQKQTYTTEELASLLYERYRPDAERFFYPYKRTGVSAETLPCIFFLGNHSSGKSTLINFLLGGLAVQDTGVAPTDDGFTVLVYGDVPREVVGDSALALLPPEYARLKTFGATFLQHLRVKVTKRDILKQCILIDSPGMIDVRDREIIRDYNFFGAIHSLAELSDLIVMMFDPDKPGTTGESIEVLTGPLSGMTFKLRLLMNKCDLFANMYDYARAYGALCWNLAHALPIKDLPKIYNCCVPCGNSKATPDIDIKDFQQSLQDIVGQISHASERRKDNVLAAANTDFSSLGMQMRMGLRLRKFLSQNFLSKLGLYLLLLLLLAGAGFILFNTYGVSVRDLTSTMKIVVFTLQCLATAGITVVIARLLYPAFRAYVNYSEHQILEKLDEHFEQEYADDLLTLSRDDLRQCWEALKPNFKHVLTSHWRQLPRFARRKIDALTKDVEELNDFARTPTSLC